MLYKGILRVGGEDHLGGGQAGGKKSDVHPSLSMGNTLIALRQTGKAWRHKTLKGPVRQADTRPSRKAQATVQSRDKELTSSPIHITK